MKKERRRSSASDKQRKAKILDPQLANLILEENSVVEPMPLKSNNEANTEA